MEALPTLVVLGLFAAGTVLWIWALADVLRGHADVRYRSGSQLIWVLVIAVTHAVGALLYVAVGRPRAGAR